MTKEEARNYLDDYFRRQIKQCIDFGVSPFCKVPIMDEVAVTEIYSADHDKPISFNQYTFKGLIKIAYDLEDKQ